MGSGKFTVTVTVSKNGKDTLFALQKALSGRGKNSSAFGEFIVPKELVRYNHINNILLNKQKNRNLFHLI